MCAVYFQVSQIKNSPLSNPTACPSKPSQSVELEAA